MVVGEAGWLLLAVPRPRADAATSGPRRLAVRAG
jgi:hypothetical protein